MGPLHAGLPLLVLCCYVARSSSLDSTLNNIGYTLSSANVHRERVLSTKENSDGSFTKHVVSVFDSVAETLEELLTREAALAQRELERHLFGTVGSLPPLPVPVSSPVKSPSLAPTNDNCLNGRTPSQFLLETLIEVTSPEELLDPATPQGRAFNFILNDTLIGEDVCAYGTIEQRYGLGKSNITSTPIGN
jgi:hypothetical protein